MPSEVMSEMVMIILVVVLGLVVLGFSFGYLVPQISFANAQNQASNLASSSSISVGPLLIGPGNVGSFVVMLYDPAYNGSAYIYAFAVPSYDIQSAGTVTPTSPSTFYAYLPNGSLTPSLTTSATIYDVSGKILYQGNVKLFQVPFNQPVTIKINNVNSNDIVVIWYIVNEGGYLFRISYTYTGVPSS